MPKSDPLAQVRMVEAAMSAQAKTAWRSAVSREGLSDHEALVAHADTLSRWSERLWLAMEGALTGDEEWLATDTAGQ